MNDEVKQTTAEPTGSDTAQLIAAITLVLGGIIAYYVLKSRPEAWASWVAMFGGIAVGFLVFAFSQYGRNFWRFVLESRVELRKVFWPTRQETTRTMLVVMAVVILMSLMLAGMDLVIQAAVKWLVGNG